MKKLFVLIFVFVASLSYAQNAVKNVDAAAFKKLVDEKKSVLIDLRTTDEIKKKGMIKGATQIDFLNKDAETQIAKLDPKKTYLVYCAGGGRSADCGELMQKLGFKSVINLENGFDSWKKQGFDIEKL